MTERLDWKKYFMYIAIIASLRSNCSRRNVGCLIVKDNIILSTGMNGTPRGLLNCFEGGCPRCADKEISKGHDLDNCLCIHAEENAMLEVDRHKLTGAYLYCTCHPCLGCSKKLIQCGIKKIYYLTEYSKNDFCKETLLECGIETEQVEINLEENIISKFKSFS